MESQYGEAIVKRIQDTLGPEWTVGVIGFNDPFFFVTPALVEGKPERFPLMLTWVAEDEPGLAVGAGKVLAMGTVLGKQLDIDAPLDEVLAKVVETWQSRKDKKRRGLFSR